ncbi:hypothetical protein VTL71DRAFT_2725 [Oculimacula yallundae]|uniref:RNase H type-1 domain-containing protein n=1 Tax=Oculimacula yallundae TaxID=86028 RepID=A0ABR4CBY8_9HELO
MGGDSHPPVDSVLLPKDEDFRRDSNSVPGARKEYTVLVTGFGAYPDGHGGHYAASDNTSHLVTQHLPNNIPANHPLNPTGLPIRTLNPTSGPDSAVKSEYAYIRSYVKTLHAPSQEVNTLDAIVHLGMADGWEWYTVEERAFKEGMSSTWWSERAKSGYYLVPDDTGKTVLDITGKDAGMWEGSPMGIMTRLNVDKVVADAKSSLISDNVKQKEVLGDGKELDVQIIPHFEAGNYCCGFIYYESLATCLKRKLDTKVVFCHVPGWRDEKRLKRGADVLIKVEQVEEGVSHCRSRVSGRQYHRPSFSVTEFEQLQVLSTIPCRQLSFDEALCQSRTQKAAFGVFFGPGSRHNVSALIPDIRVNIIDEAAIYATIMALETIQSSDISTDLRLIIIKSCNSHLSAAMHKKSWLWEELAKQDSVNFPPNGIRHQLVELTLELHESVIIQIDRSDWVVAKDLISRAVKGGLNHVVAQSRGSNWNTGKIRVNEVIVVPRTHLGF